MKRVLVLVASFVALVALAPPAPAATTVSTVPAVKGVPFLFRGRVYRTNAAGRVTLPTNRSLRDRLTVADAKVGENARATFARWYGNLDVPKRGLIAALDLHFRVGWSFTDLEKRGISNARVTTISFRSSHGIVRKFPRSEFGRAHWFQGSRVISTPEGPRRKDLYYTVEKVIVDGANVVNRAQQRFFPAHRRHVPVRLLFYSAHFSAHDAVFKFAIGDGIELRFPNGRVERHAFGPDGELTVDRLPRGQYWVVVDAPGMSFLRPVSLSRNQTVALEVLSWIDIAFVVGVLAAIAVGLLLVGRPWLLRYASPETYRERWSSLRSQAAEGSP